MKADVCRAGPVDVSWSRKSRPALQSHGFGAKTLKKRKREKSCVFWWIVSFLLWREKNLGKDFSVVIDGDYELRCIKKQNKTKQKQKKNRKNPKKTNKWAQRRSEFLMHRNEWIKVVQLLSMIWCFYFINTEIFFLSYQHISNIGIERMWECVVRSIRDTNDSISQCKSLYIWNSLFCSRLDCSCLSRPIQVGINFWNFQPLVRSVRMSWPWAVYIFDQNRF